ncbi:MULTISPECIES: ABC transporter ATP-binding protein [Saccharothrix]|uniref:ABC transporter ATP-binding protein n=1 Tax=Saccharothrix TaxID=2071 RepID=UPI00093EB908|nr:ABC transporter ATP-binding protein [Saccharothrix sp. CB00851]OKI17796.1 hypothetical protein A6A25_40285 [Saccharothrix sp. CB00851]
MTTGHPGQRDAGALRRWYAEAVRPRYRTLRQLPTLGVGLVVPLSLISLARGGLPVVLVLAGSKLVGQVPQAVEHGVGSPAWGDLVSWFVLAAAAFVAQQVLTPVQLGLTEMGKRRVDGVVHDRLITLSLGSPGIAPLEDPTALDALAEAKRRLERGGETPGAACVAQFGMLARYLNLIGLVVLLGVVVSWLLAVLLLAVVLLSRHAQLGGHRRCARVWDTAMPLLRRGDYLRDLAMGAGAAKELRVFGLRSWLSDRYAEAARRCLDVIWRGRRAVYLYPYLVFTAVGLVATGLVLVTIGRTAAGGGLPLTELALALQAVVAAILMGDHWTETDLPTAFGITAALAADRFEDRIAEVERRTSITAGDEGLDPAGMPRSAVVFRGVRFGYPDAPAPVLDGLDLVLPSGKCTAVVGVNGAGKTTLVKLLARLYEPTAGRIEVDGVPLDAFPAQAWRCRLSVIFQDFVRYELSVTDNVAFGAPHVPPDPEAVRAALERAGAAGFVDGLPDGVATPLSRAFRDGVELSGGQWQRIAIARALYSLSQGAGLLVLDEPTAALDVRAEAAFFDRFVDLTRNVTSVLISHRFSSVRRADHIVVLDRGRVAEQGTHEELIAGEGHYARLFTLQAQRFADGSDRVPGPATRRRYDAAQEVSR